MKTDFPLAPARASERPAALSPSRVLTDVVAATVSAATTLITSVSDVAIVLVTGGALVGVFRLGSFG